MNTIEIEKTVARDKCLNRIFLGVFPSDKLPIITSKPCCFIANTDTSAETGEHWIAMFFDKNVEYFDSYGLKPMASFDVYKPDIINNYCLQRFNSVVCGEYCIYYLYKRARGISLKNIVDYLRKRNNSDKIVKFFVDKIRVKSKTNNCQTCKTKNASRKYCVYR